MNVKDMARSLVESLPIDATWNDLLERIRVQEAIDRGLEASAAGQVLDSDYVRRKLSLTS